MEHARLIRPGRVLANVFLILRAHPFVAGLLPQDFPADWADTTSKKETSA